MGWLSHYHQEMVGFSGVSNKVLFIPEWGGGEEESTPFCFKESNTAAFMSELP